MEENEEIAEKLEAWGLDKIAKKKHIQPRDVLKGGRVENRALHMNHEEDFMSLCPDRMLHTPYMLGHPWIYTCNISKVPKDYFGVIKGSILPPKHLEMPVLPVNVTTRNGTGKLMFPLCRTCAEEQNFAVDSCALEEDGVLQVFRQYLFEDKDGGCRLSGLGEDRR